MTGSLATRSYGIGQPVRRVEDTRFLTGRGRYVDDIELAHQTHACIVQSPHATRVFGVSTPKPRARPRAWCAF